MNHGKLSPVLLISLVSCSAIAHAQSFELDGTHHTTSSEASGMTRASGSSWEGWLTHGARDFTPESHVPPQSPDLGAPTSPLSPSIGPGSGLLGPEAGSGPIRFRSDEERDFGGTASERGRR